jgi:hypothetical protein
MKEAIHQNQYIMKTMIFILLGINLLMVTSCIKTNDEDSIIPEGAIWKSQTIKYELAPEGYTTLAVWANAATLKLNQSYDKKAIIYIDHWKVIEHQLNKDTVLFENFYDGFYDQPLSINEGGLYCRIPTWFDSTCNDAHDLPYNMIITNGNLKIDAAQEPNKIIHWWTPRQRSCYTSSYSVEVTLKVEGAVSVQFGLDYWKDFNCGWNKFDPFCQTSNNCEAWISDWIGDTQGKYITVNLPKY